ncbi:CAP domain-containing protein [Sedimentibacter sp. zth1]|uniref:CAP domain-containing protein n=1 Tax=Sedimentibacter sp. zth1 TaxID=2816908 RepID=UPI00353053BD
MKNKVITLSLLITAMSIFPAFGNTNDNCNSNVLNNFNSNCYILTKGVESNKNCENFSQSNCNIDIFSFINKYMTDKSCNNKYISILNSLKSRFGQKNDKPSVTTPNNNKPNITVPNNNKPNVTVPNNNKPSVTVPEKDKPSITIPEKNKPSITVPEKDKPSITVPEKDKPSITVPEKDKPSTENTNTSVSSFEKKVVELVNVERTKNGLTPLKLDTSISNVARIKSKDMATNNYFSHTSPTYGSAGNMLTKYNISYTAWGENIAAGQRTPEEVVNAWMNSSGHRANILSSTFTKIGVGYATNSSGKAYWTQMFTR